MSTPRFHASFRRRQFPFQTDPLPKNRKATKNQARECYDHYFGILRCLNGGTRDENIRNAPHCRESLEPVIAIAKDLASNPSKLLAADAWLMRALTEDIPNNFAAFVQHYPQNVIPFPNP